VADPDSVGERGEDAGGTTGALSGDTGGPVVRRVVVALSFAAAAFHLYAAGVTPFTALVQRPVHLALMGTLGFLGVGLLQGREPPLSGRPRLRWPVTLLLVAATLFSCAYLAMEHEALVRRVGAVRPLDLAAGVLSILLVLELARRTTGWGLVSVAILALVYAWVGPYLPGALAHRGYGPVRLVEHLYLTTEGIWGIPLGVSADFVYLFILFGAVLEAAGGGTLLIALAERAAGGTRGGPAKTASVASAFMGSLSGSAVANVATTGTFTIPLMKRSGFRPHFAGAIEAAASTGGQLMPPIMGAGAFIMATWTNIPYATIALAAILPAALYYLALFMAIHFRASAMGLGGGTEVERDPVLPRLHLLLPLGVVVWMLAIGRSPMRAAFWGVVGAGALAVLRPATRLGRDQLTAAVVRAGEGTVQVAAACATAGIVVGVASLTGIGLRMSELIVTLSGGHLWAALLLTAVGSVILGMGLPTTAAYVVLAALGAPGLVELGVPTLAAHLFIFYFGCISNVTPPVSLAAYAAAGIAGSAALQTAVTAMLLAGAGFLVPFMFVYGPELLGAGAPHMVAIAALTGAVGVTGLAAAVVGYARRTLAGWERIVLAAAAAVLVFPGLVTDAAGLAVAVGLMVRGGSENETAAGDGEEAGPGATRAADDGRDPRIEEEKG